MSLLLLNELLRRRLSLLAPGTLSPRMTLARAQANTVATADRPLLIPGSMIGLTLARAQVNSVATAEE